MLKKSIICGLMVSIVVLAFASKGGGDKKKTPSLLKAFTPIRTSQGFTLRASPSYSYSGSLILSTQHKKNFVMFNSVVTYEKGNTIYILPYHYKMNTNENCFRSNLNLLDLKIRLHK